MFPTGCRTRRIDGSGRIKLQTATISLSETLGWADGALDVTITDSWAVLTQRRDLVGAPRRRNSCHAGFSVHDSLERIALRPTHLQLLGLATGDEALIAVVPDAAAVIICDPNLIVAVAPAYVMHVVNPPVDDDTAASVTDITTRRPSPASTTRMRGAR
jgi:hypothetical protein